jgi:DNA ligase-1
MSLPLNEDRPAQDEAIRPAPFEDFCRTAERIRATSKRLEKARALAEYFDGLSDADLRHAARYFAGYVFPLKDQRTTNVGGSAVMAAIREVTGLSDEELGPRLVALGDIGDVAGEIFPPIREGSATLTLEQVAQALAVLSSTSGSNRKRELVTDLLRPATALEAKYLVKLLLGDLRIGLLEGAVEDGVARWMGVPVGQVQWTNMLLGDVGETAVLARHGRLGEARMQLFHPIKFMLATPAADLDDVARQMPAAFVTEDKYDGIRAQAHIAPDTFDAATHGVSANGVRVALFSRTLDEITKSFPDLVEPLAKICPPPTPPVPEGVQEPSSPNPFSRRGEKGNQIFNRAAIPAGVGEGRLITEGDAPLGAVSTAGPTAGTSRFISDTPSGTGGVGGGLGLILDGEILPVREDVILPFQELQKRLGRKTLTEALRASVPVAFVAYDCLYGEGRVLIEEPWSERRRVLEQALPGHGPVRATPSRLFDDTAALDAEFDAARARGNEGLMVKDPASTYKPGRRGREWLKIKRALATLDVVVTAVEVGNGGRSKFLSDYTFAVRASETDPTLLNVGKAYSGLTDAEIAELSVWFREHTLQEFWHGKVRVVEPKIVLEVTFDRVQASKRHKSGYALRFPRIVRIRPDKPPEEIDTLQTVKELAGE